MRGLLITLLVLTGLLVAADFGAKAIAEDRVGAALQDSLDLPVTPSVDVNGFPFLAQAAGGRYDDVDLTAPGIRYGELQDLTLTAKLGGVALPPSNLLDGQVTSIPTGEVTASALVNPVDLARILDVSDVSVQPVTQTELDEQIAAARADDSGAAGSARALGDVDPASSVRLLSTTSVAGQELRVAVLASFRLAGGRISLSARDIRIEGGSGALGTVASAALRSRLSGFSTSVDPGQLPFSITATDLAARDGMLVVSGSARDVDLLRGSA